MAQIQTPRMNHGDLRSVIRAFIANTIPKNRSHEIRVNVRMLDTRDNTAKEKIGTFPKTSAPFDFNFRLFFINKSADCPPNYHKTAIMFPKITE